MSRRLISWLSEYLLRVRVFRGRKHDERGDRRDAEQTLCAGVQDRLRQEVWIVLSEMSEDRQRLLRQLGVLRIDGRLECAGGQHTHEGFLVIAKEAGRALVVDLGRRRVCRRAEEVVDFCSAFSDLHMRYLLEAGAMRLLMASMTVCHFATPSATYWERT